MSDRAKIVFSWNLILECNYRCPYCWFYRQWQDEKVKSHPPVRELVRCWRNIYKRYGSVDIDVLGGEPFLYPGFTDLIIELSGMHKLGITTNLSCDVKGLVKKADPSRVGIRSSFHPLFADFDAFLEKALLLKEKGFSEEIAYVAYPSQIKQIDHYKARFEKQGLSFAVFSFWGKYKGRDYPLSYTEEERDFLEPHLGERCGEKFQATPKTFRGLLCNAGHRFAVIYEGGRVVKCGGSGPHKIIGNFYKDDFRLLDGPEPCDSENCPCNEWAFLLVDKK